MKAFYMKSLIVVSLAITLSSCEKKAENMTDLSEKKSGLISEKVYPLGVDEMSTSILPKRDLPASVLFNYNNRKVKVIDSVCEEYIKGTTKFDISKLKDGEFRYDIKDKKLTISSTTGFKKLNNGPKGWWTHWNYSPYVESEYPNVLFSEGKDGYVSNFLVLTFSKKVTFFGFEVAPNITGVNLKCSVGYEEEDSKIENEMFSVNQTVSSPSGARLIAVKSETPIKKVTIYLEDYNPELKGLAITNIRYALAK